jgi:endo-1,4-beta-D-glucanase Y
VKSHPIGTSHSPKYLYWHEIEKAYSKGLSLLVLQFFPRKSHPDFIRRRRREIADHTGSKNVIVYDARRVCYFLAAHENHLTAVEATNRALEHVLINSQIRLVPS